MGISLNTPGASVLAPSHHRMDQARERLSHLSFAEKELILILGDQGGKLSFSGMSPARQRIYRRLSLPRQGRCALVRIFRRRTSEGVELIEENKSSAVSYGGRQVYNAISQIYKDNGYVRPC